MNEEERIREEALLNDDEIVEAICSIYPPFYEDDEDEAKKAGYDSEYRDAQREAIAQAQLDKVLKDKRVHIEADNQDLPENPYIDEPNGYVYEQAQQDMLNPKDGDVWVKCKVKEVEK